MQKGHMRKDCPTGAAFPPREAGSYAAAVARPRLSVTEETPIDTAQETTIQNSTPETGKTVESPILQSQKPTNTSFLPFFTKNNIFSNHYPTKF